jgi:hypothetical protein
MKIGRRVRVYLVGVGMGLIATYFMFNGRGCEWMPGKRVLSSIEDSQLVISEFRACQMDCYGLSSQDVFNAVNRGSVLFSESETSGPIKNYVVADDKCKITFALNTADSISEVLRFHEFNEKCACGNQSDSVHRPLFMPSNMILSKLYENGFELTQSNSCQFECAGIDSLTALSIFKDGKVIHEQSYPRQRPNPIYMVELNQSSGEKLFFKVEKGLRTRILEVNSDRNTANCPCN